MGKGEFPKARFWGVNDSAVVVLSQKAPRDRLTVSA